jgi:hypothetical protein
MNESLYTKSSQPKFEQAFEYLRFFFTSSKKACSLQERFLPKKTPTKIIREELIIASCVLSNEFQCNFTMTIAMKNVKVDPQINCFGDCIKMSNTCRTCMHNKYFSHLFDDNQLRYIRIMKWRNRRRMGGEESKNRP